MSVEVVPDPRGELPIPIPNTVVCSRKSGNHHGVTQIAERRCLLIPDSNVRFGEEPSGVVVSVRSVECRETRRMAMVFKRPIATKLKRYTTENLA